MDDDAAIIQEYPAGFRGTFFMEGKYVLGFEIF